VFNLQIDFYFQIPIFFVSSLCRLTGMVNMNRKSMMTNSN